MTEIYPRDNYPKSILVVDDEEVIQEVLADFFSDEGYLVRAVGSGKKALEEISRHYYHLVLADLKMPEMGGIQLLEKVKAVHPEMVAIIMTGYGTMETAIEAIKKGAYDYILKPFKVKEILRVVEKGLEKQALEQENIQLKKALSLYELSEAMSTRLELDKIIYMIMGATFAEISADAIALYLKERRSDRFKLHNYRFKEEDEKGRAGLGRFHTKRVIGMFEKDQSILVHGEDVRKLFQGFNKEHPITSFASVPLKVKEKIFGVLNTYSFTEGFRFTEGQRKILYVLASRAAVAMENARLYEEIQETFRETIKGFAIALEAKDKYTHGHSEKVTKYAKMIARALECSPEEIEIFSHAAMLHDIGKIRIGTEYLHKVHKLTEREQKIFQSHPSIGENILRPLHFLQDVIPSILHHHERWDGEGYPDGLAGEAIPLGARILAVADTYDAMTSDRAYRQSLRHEEAMEELTTHAGTQFDPNIVKLFTREMAKIRRKKTKPSAKSKRAQLSSPKVLPPLPRPTHDDEEEQLQFFEDL